MPLYRLGLFLACLGSCVWLSASERPAPAPPAAADEAPATPPGPPLVRGGEEGEARSVEQLTELTRKSVVVITVQGRDGKQQGLGTGFVVSADGLIATNMHVIGEARPISVQTADGQQHTVTAVHATDRAADLALVRVEAKDLPALELGDSSSLKQGEPVIALGNPHGLKHSVVSGVVSGSREIDGRPMIQLAIPIEPGNSGGPLLDMQGRVRGIITMKSLVTPNLGFAVGVNQLKPLIEKPNPVPMSRWLTIGTLDPREWTPLFGARWRQRAGRILVDGLGQGFGGRSLCLSAAALPELPFEIAVKVKLKDEQGAAGLVFDADGSDRHFGFYPSAGKLRFTRFDGPDVFSWQVLQEKPSPHYKPGDWNTLKVRLEKDKVLCYVNGGLLFETATTNVPRGKLGLAKFRDTEAEFKSFQVAGEIRPDGASDEALARIDGLTKDLPLDGAFADQLLDGLTPESPASLTALRGRAKTLEQQAVRLRKLAEAVHERRVQQELKKVFSAPEAGIDLLQAALLIAQLDNDELDVAAYQKAVERIVADVKAALPENADDKAKLAALNKHLFTELGFHGSRSDYYNRANSYLNEVLDDREGLPITLCVLYMELSRRLGVNVVGIGLPGHFMAQHVPASGDPQLIDVYESAAPLTRAEAETKIAALSGRKLNPEDWQPVTKQAMAVRMLGNLMGLARDAEDLPAMLRYVEAMVAISPDAAQERWYRAVLRFQTGQREAAAQDVEWLLEHSPEGIDLERVRELGRLLERGG